jgi:hypothetical protein
VLIKKIVEMKHVTTFENFLSESAFHAALAKAKKEGLKEFEFQGKKYPIKEDALEEGEDLNEAAKDKNYEISFWENHAKSIYDYKTKMYDFAKKAIDALPKILEECCPGKFDVDTIGFGERGNAFFVYVNLLDSKDRIGFNYTDLEDSKDIREYFDIVGSNFDSSSQRMYTTSFRLNDKKA